MKCSQCGAPVTLEDEFCPYCGAMNRAARKHLEDMKKYSRRFEATRAEVKSTAAAQMKRHSGFAVLAIVGLLNCILIIGLMFARSPAAEEILDRIRVSRNAEKYVSVLTDYETQRDYTGLYIYYRRERLDYWQKESRLKDLNDIYWVARGYTWILNDFYYLEQPESDLSARGTADLLNEISKFYVMVFGKDGNKYYHPGQMEEIHRTAILDMKDGVQSMMRTYGKLTEEDIAKLDQMEALEITLLLKKRMGTNES